MKDSSEAVYAEFRVAELDVHGGEGSVGARPVVVKRGRGKRTAIPSVASDEPEHLGAADGEDVADEEPVGAAARQRRVVRAATRRPTVDSDVPGSSSRISCMESLLAEVIASFSDDSHKVVVSKALKAYDQVVLKDSRKIHANQQRIEEAQREIKNSQLSIQRAQKRLIDDISSLRSRNTEGARSEPSARDNRASKRRLDVSPSVL